MNLQAAQLAHEQRPAPLRGQLAEVARQRGIRSRDSIDALGRGIAHLGGRFEAAVRAPRSQQRDRLVVRDPVQPGSQRDLARLARQRAIRLEHRGLQRVGGVVPVADDRVAVPVQRLMMALEDHREGGLAAARRPARESLVGHASQRRSRRSEDGSAGWEGVGLHALSIGNATGVPGVRRQLFARVAARSGSVAQRQVARLPRCTPRWIARTAHGG